MTRFSLFFAALIALMTPVASWAVSVSANLAITVTATAPPGFYVATTGSDSNSGSLASPFATLGKCQTAMRGGSTKTCYLRAGTYTPSSAGSGCCFVTGSSAAVHLTSSDNGETWKLYPSDPVGSAIIDGQSTTGNSGSVGNGLTAAFWGDGASNVTIDGLVLTRFNLDGVWTNLGSGWLVKNNEVKNSTGAVFTNAGIAFISTPGSTADHNYVHDVQFMGIGGWSSTTAGASNLTFSSNVIKNSCEWAAVSGGGNDQNGGDCGGIYLEDLNNPIPASSTNISVINNYIQDVNVSSNGAGDFGIATTPGIYLDAGASAVTMTGNVIFGITSMPIFINGGKNNLAKNNLLDANAVLGTNRTNGMAVQSCNKSGCLSFNPSGNAYTQNLLVASGSAAGSGLNCLTSVCQSTSTANFYHNYVGSTINTTGNGGNSNDSNPQGNVATDPGLSCWAPAVAVSSPPTTSATAFPSGLVGGGGWGPPGLVIPQTGTAPSWPHAC